MGLYLTTNKSSISTIPSTSPKVTFEDVAATFLAEANHQSSQLKLAKSGSENASAASCSPSYSLKAKCVQSGGGMKGKTPRRHIGSSLKTKKEVTTTVVKSNSSSSASSTPRETILLAPPIPHPSILVHAEGVWNLQTVVHHPTKLFLSSTEPCATCFPEARLTEGVHSTSSKGVDTAVCSNGHTDTHTRPEALAPGIGTRLGVALAEAHARDNDLDAKIPSVTVLETTVATTLTHFSTIPISYMPPKAHRIGREFMPESEDVETMPSAIAVRRAAQTALELSQPSPTPSTLSPDSNPKPKRPNPPPKRKSSSVNGKSLRNSKKAKIHQHFESKNMVEGEEDVIMLGSSSDSEPDVQARLVLDSYDDSATATGL
ncbi:hypothetical protein F4604DRAFT_2038237 [Suillus subluteus]|nr:hypothetical protein F4604DRAFT_2038237 [Suillus subluteus]